MNPYYFALASEKFLLRQEPIEEILRERTKYYEYMNKPIDFWLIKPNLFLEVPEILEVGKKLSGPIAAVISTNVLFITWLKLRLSFVITGSITKTILK
uniref:Ycf54 n=1 Tax=Apophlaea sinclairii TaxID=212746 RepID=A0A1C9CBL5_9FLOR|nr:hypothetical protein Apop_098 [Apophlaea sinclairii]AOM65788.1 hypothetical protein Apop_098 [Apophlaea sinclairii]